MGEVFTIARLEQCSGVPRSTIRYYVHEGLLPPAQKSLGGRGLYGDEHEALLRRIKDLKAAGHTLAEIRQTLGADLDRARENERNLAREESERVRQLILRAATEEFATNGYERTHISSIIAKAGITRQVLYAHFTSKLELLVESFRTFMAWNISFSESRLADSSDLGERVLSRLVADERASRLAADVLSHIRAERGHSVAERRRLAERAWEGVAELTMRELEGLTEPSRRTDVPFELLAYSLIGAHHSAVARASRDKHWSREDVYKTHLWIWLAVSAALTGAVDVDGQLATYESLVRELVSRPLETPPALADTE
jgi:DNA-binding transcriptional MerR regulator